MTIDSNKEDFIIKGTIWKGENLAEPKMFLLLGICWISLELIIFIVLVPMYFIPLVYPPLVAHDE